MADPGGAPSTVTVSCARCGAAVPDGARFCWNCGAPQAQAREERRVVTVLFGDLAGFTELSERRDAEEVKTIVDRAFEQLTSLVVSYGGHVDKVIGDEIMAVFGAPLAHEDDPERAVRAALAMQRHIADYSAELEVERDVALQIHIGINTGEVVAGYVAGSDAYTVVGDTVNVARRISDAADAGQVLVGQQTYETTGDAIAYRSIGQVSAKGKRLPLPVWEALAERGLPGERPPRALPLIGREEELAALAALAKIVRRDRRPLMTTIVGEAGMGKSRLAEEFSRRAHRLGMRVLHGRSLPYGTASPAFALEEILRAALLVDPAAEPDEARDWIRGRLEGFGLGGYADTLSAFLGVGGSIPVRSTQGESSAALEAAAVLLERIASEEDGLVVNLHELHWAEDAVLDFAQRLLGSARAPLLIVCLARPDLVERRPTWGAPVGSVMLPLDPLPRERAAEMLDMLAPTLPLAVREGVLDRAGGNPFYLEELARLLLDRREPVEEVSVPLTVQALVAARLDALPSRTKRLIQDASVVGERFWPGALEVLGADDVSTHLDAPEVRELVEPSDGTTLRGDRPYRFRQTIVREVAYSSVPKQTRARQHAMVGAWLEEMTRHPSVPPEFDALIAYQYERAATLAGEVGEGQQDAGRKARDFLERAGDRARGIDASMSAARLFRRALPFARDERDELSLRIRLCDALVGSYRHDEAEPELERVLGSARRLGERATEGVALRLLGDSFRMRGDLARARDPIELGLQIAKELGDGTEEAAGLRARGQLDLFAGRWSSAVLWFRQALARYRELGDLRGEAWVHQNLGTASLFLGRYDEALEYLAEGERVFRDLGDEEGAGWSVGVRAWVLLLRGDLVEAARIAESLEQALTVEHPEYLQGAGFVLELQRILRAYVEVLRGHLGSAESHARAALATGDWAAAGWVRALASYPIFASAILRRMLHAARAAVEHGGPDVFDDPLYSGQFAFARAWLAYEEGDIAETERILDELARDDERGQLWRRNSGSRWLRALVLRAKGDLLGARALLSEEPGVGGISLVPSSVATALLAEIMTELGDVDAAIETASSCANEAGEELIGRAPSMRALAGALQAAGRPADAEKVLREELALLESSDWEIERVKAMAALSRVLDAQRRHDEASDLLDRARARLGELPQGADAGPVQEALLS